MEIGIFARTFPADCLEQNLDAVEDSGFGIVHFNLKCAGLESLPAEIHESRIHDIRIQFEIRDLKMAAISGTFNAIDPDLDLRMRMTERCVRLIEEAPSLGTHVVTLCTGTRDPGNMWRAHPGNDSPEAWKDLLETLSRLVPIAEESGVVLGIEPELANVINSAEKARRLLDDLQSPALGIVLDGANLISPDRIARMGEILRGAVDLLADRLIMAHAKDIPKESEGSQAAGRGALDWETYLKALGEVSFEGPIILHNLSPDEVKESRKFVENHWRNLCEGGS
ncbi:MAG: sugar phosphate isomerase/epimerase [Candidatus Omnitrophica bacterium]|nr:sugar phosphate isomerase/epimerase [Candidatus Omnitrophota bacterium]